MSQIDAGFKSIFEKYCLQNKPHTVYIRKKKFAVMQKKVY